MHWETKKSCDSFYCNICLITLVWNQTLNISKVCLYTLHCIVQKDPIPYIKPFMD